MDINPISTNTSVKAPQAGLPSELERYGKLLDTAHSLAGVLDDRLTPVSTAKPDQAEPADSRPVYDGSPFASELCSNNNSLQNLCSRLQDTLRTLDV